MNYRIVKQNGVQLGQNCVLGVPMTNPPTEDYFDRDRRSIMTRLLDRAKQLEAEIQARRAIAQNQMVQGAQLHSFAVVNQQQARVDFLKGKGHGWWKV